MQKAKMLLMILMILALVAVPSTSASAGGPAGGWRSGISCQNLNASDDATVTLTFYREGTSDVAVSYTGTIAKGSSVNWLTTSPVSMPNFPTNFIGSAVISSSTELACNLNTESTSAGTRSSPYRMATASGFNDSQTAPVMYISQITKGVQGYQSYIAVQNTSTSDVTVNVKYYRGNGSEVSGAAESGLVKGQSTKVFYTSDNNGFGGDFNGGARVEAADGTTKLAVLVATYRPGTTVGDSQFQTYNGVGDGSNKLYVPRFVRNMLGNNSGLTIQNVGSVATPVSVTFSFPNGQYTVSTDTDLPPNASWILYAPSLAALANVDQLNESSRQGSAVVVAGDASAKLSANINENNLRTGDIRYGQGATYNAILDGKQSTNLFFPQFTKAVCNTFWSGFQISNTTDQPGTCDIEYTKQPGLVEDDVPLPANGSIGRWAKSGVDPVMKAMVAGYNGPVKVTCTQPVTGIVNFSAYNNKFGDSFEMTAGLNQ